MLDEVPRELPTLALPDTEVVALDVKDDRIAVDAGVLDPMPAV